MYNYYDDIIVTVCKECLKSSCWQGIEMCERSRNADITTRTIKELKKLNLESEQYWLWDQKNEYE